MKKISNISENDMIAEFLLAEIDSVNFGSDLRDFLAQTEYDENIIYHPNTNNDAENEARKLALGYRGYPNAYLFEGLPKCNSWYTAKFMSRDFNSIKTINCEDWLTDTDQTRDFKVLSKKLRNHQINKPLILKIAADYNLKKHIPMPIILKDSKCKNFVVFEGNHRVAALALLELKEFSAIVGEFNDLVNWRWK